MVVRQQENSWVSGRKFIQLRQEGDSHLVWKDRTGVEEEKT